MDLLAGTPDACSLRVPQFSSTVVHIPEEPPCASAFPFVSS